MQIIQNEVLAWIIAICLVIVVIIQITTVIMDETGKYSSRKEQEEKDNKIIDIQRYRK